MASTQQGAGQCQPELSTGALLASDVSTLSIAAAPPTCELCEQQQHSGLEGCVAAGRGSLQQLSECVEAKVKVLHEGRAWPGGERRCSIDRGMGAAVRAQGLGLR
jgi:hypothetical protein